MNLEELFESSEIAFGKKGDEIVRKYRCLSGPRKGRLVNNPSDCDKRVDIEKRLRFRKLLTKFGKKFARIAKRTKRINPTSKKLQARNKALREANILGSSIHLNKIPKKYRDLPLIGRGTTSLVFDEGDNVILMTRDQMKKEWIDHADLGTFIEEVDVYHPYPALNQMPVYVYRMKKLYKLSGDNLKKVKNMIRKLQDTIQTHPKRVSSDEFYQVINELIDVVDLDFSDQTSFRDFLDFIMNYDKNDYGLDLLVRNFMQDADGKIIATDPVVATEIIKAFRRR